MSLLHQAPRPGAGIIHGRSLGVELACSIWDPVRITLVRTLMPSMYTPTDQLLTILTTHSHINNCFTVAPPFQFCDLQESGAQARFWLSGAGLVSRRGSNFWTLPRTLRGSVACGSEYWFREPCPRIRNGTTGGDGVRGGGRELRDAG